MSMLDKVNHTILRYQAKPIISTGLTVDMVFEEYRVYKGLCNPDIRSRKGNFGICIFFFLLLFANCSTSHIITIHAYECEKSNDLVTIFISRIKMEGKNYL